MLTPSDAALTELSDTLLTAQIVAAVYCFVMPHPTGTFPAWLITNVPQLVSSCQCSVGINLDGAKFSCPKSLPRLARQAQTILHRFEFLQCITDDQSLKGVDGRQLIPIYYLAAGPGQRPMMSRAEHKQQVMQWHMVEQEVQEQHGQHHWQQRHRKGAVAGAVVGVLAAVVMAAAAALVVLKSRQRGWRSAGNEVGCMVHYSWLFQTAAKLPAAWTLKHLPSTAESTRA